MTEAELAAIEERAHKARITIYPHVRDAFFESDVPALVAALKHAQARIANEAALARALRGFVRLSARKREPTMKEMDDLVGQAKDALAVFDDLAKASQRDDDD